MSVFIFVFSFLLESFQILLLIGFDFLLQVEAAMMLTGMFEAWLGVISSLLVRLYLSFPHVLIFIH